MATARAAVLLTGFILSAVLLMPLQWLGLKLGLPYARTLPNRYHRFLCRLIGIKVIRFGEPHSGGACLITANHTSWLDIPIIASLEPCSFVAKSEVAGWPFFGTLAKLQQTVFVERERRTRTAHSRNEIHARIAAGDRLVLFPEGTSSDGNRVLSFKSALMSVAQLTIVNGEEDREDDLVVQPVSVAYTGLYGMPMGRYFRPFFAWYGDMELFPHLWEAFSLGPIEVTVEYHKPVTIREIGNRKALAAYCEACCREGVTRALNGRRDEGKEAYAEPAEAVARPRVAGA
ncbi:lysophospholipid acyltransferase family protein [Parvibaculum sp.]|jgi:1-acyl-sn-glycerol-3-phosphate acyltransferase|uniref:lysophospholipid acyltransferase family protein n=1 Tax=Parvibaculum sp. TaxID=2024848 RepID=UPI001B2D6B0E|nr:lysophospholipid acyltransferase family protein [Parvibaculum sp.]MBO6633961.1 1-acyl-sn-glycerol-3-phosphate acyltransferase [Parvibaculum sp.]MBO6677549.1 1-acyl-sn-glycerol-3-phosphate acyltransferase [Parvibaculum sp.]MBO6685342.1 1-acyl-sn-glycerol-3-phosphate acyltransferase [Parvibaculum sp.]MBO6905200.1 1-acyl-sn-glycerol-3-phosphate acyltransferase [Parvibaculum sp.]